MLKLKINKGKMDVLKDFALFATFFLGAGIILTIIGLIIYGLVIIYDSTYPAIPVVFGSLFILSVLYVVYRGLKGEKKDEEVS